jgi:heterodisulfide reductase subunit A-like polyferredoxin
MKQLSRQVCVIGAGPAGLAVTGSLARQGVEVSLVEKEARPGGRLNALSAVYGPNSCARQLRTELLAALDLPGVTLITGARVEKVTGVPGAYRVGVHDRAVPAAAVVVATGFSTQYRPEDHGLALGGGVFSFTGLCDQLRRPTHELVGEWRNRRVGMAVDVSTCDSKLFSAAAMRLAMELKSRLMCEVYIFCRDAKVAGPGLEALYGEARRAGVTFIKHQGKAPVLDAGSPGFVAHLRPGEGGEAMDSMEVPLDMVILDEAVVPAPGFEGLREALGLSSSGRGRHAGVFFGSDHWRHLGVATERAGVFLCGGAHSDGDLADTLAGAAAAASAVLEFLTTPAITRARVEASQCARCLTCVRLCPYGAITIAYHRVAEKAAASIADLSCRGCGVCVAACPGRAIELTEMADAEIASRLGGAAV